MARRIALRFVLAYWLLYFPVVAVEDLPGFARVLVAYNAVWAAFIPFVTRRVLHIDRSYGDTSELRFDCSYSYVHVAVALLLALVVAAALSLVEERQSTEVAERRLARADEWIRVLVRYGLANAMFHYGVAKVLDTQFPAPSLERLVEPLAEWSRMTLLWTFMGASTLYATFGGVLECVSGALLFSRRTTTLGALLVLAVMSNVVALNFAYDVPIKGYAVHLLLMAAFLAAPDAPRIARTLVLQRSTEAPLFPPHFVDARKRKVAACAKGLFLAFFFVSEWVGAFASWRAADGASALRPALYGIWSVESFAQDGVELPARVTDRGRWRRITFDRGGSRSESRATLWRMTEEHDLFRAEIDEPHSNLVLAPRGGGAPIQLAYARSGSDRLDLTGTLDGVRTRISLRRVSVETLKLERGFRWVHTSD